MNEKPDETQVTSLDAHRKEKEKEDFEKIREEIIELVSSNDVELLKAIENLSREELIETLEIHIGKIENILNQIREVREGN